MSLRSDIVFVYSILIGQFVSSLSTAFLINMFNSFYYHSLHFAYQSLRLSITSPINHFAYQSLRLSITSPINHFAYQSITSPINHFAYQSFRLSITPHLLPMSTTPEYIDSLRENNRLLQEQNELLRAESEDRLARRLRVEEKITSLVNLVSEQQREIHHLKLAMFGEEEEND